VQRKDLPFFFAPLRLCAFAVKMVWLKERLSQHYFNAKTQRRKGAKKNSRYCFALKPVASKDSLS
jgi:hypothetical protein